MSDSKNTYTGEKPLALRPGAMDAFKLPSLQDGKLVERKRPAIISGAAVQPVGMHGGRMPT